MQLTDKDRIFLAIALPICLAAAYLFFVRTPAAGRVEALKNTVYRLGEPDALLRQRPLLQLKRDQKRRERIEAEAAASAEPQPQAVFSAVGVAGKLEKILAKNDRLLSFRSAAPAAVRDNIDSASTKAVKNALGLTPETWKITASGSYGGALAFLHLLSEENCGAVVESVSMDASPGIAPVWVFNICL